MSTHTQPKKLNIIAIGGVSKILANFPKNSNLFALETNSNNLSALPDHIQKIQFGNGDGSGGNPEFAKSLFDIKQVEPLFDCDLLILIAGLGGGTGSGITPELAKIAKEKGILTKIIAFSPLSFEGSKAKSAQVLENFKSLNLPITLIDNQQIYEKMPKNSQGQDYQETADFGANEAVNCIKSILESQNIDFNDLKKVFDYGGFCYTNSGFGKSYKEADYNLQSTTTINPSQFKTAKGMLLNFKIGTSGMTLDQEEEILKFVKLFQNEEQNNVKINKEYTKTEEFEITILVSGIGTQTKIDENYSQIIQQKAEAEKAKYISQINSQNAKRK